MKKHLITLLLSLSFAFTLAGAVACGGNDKNDSPSQSSSSPDDSESGSGTPDETPCTVHFVDGEGYSFAGNVENGGTIPGGSVLTFTVEVGAFYTGEALVYVNDEPVAPESDGTYYVSMTEDVTVRAEGIRKDVSTLSSTGLGTLESPFYVSKPVDLLYIAEQVNGGNRTYQTAAYLLINDIDCKGEELEIIGNDPDNGYYFSGSFTSNYDGNTGVSYRHSISNFKINATGTNYVGLFGAVFADLSVENSANFYGVALKDFEINANMYTSDTATQTMACGGLVGYGVGVNLLLCEASNGKINIAGDSAYFSFAGGLMGYQQGYYFSQYGLSAPSEIAYAKADVDINVLSGLVLSAGGITGHLATDYPFGAVTSIHHSYATGNVTGAIRSGGIAGSLGQYTTVNNCYSTGLITANSNQNNSNALWQDSEFCVASAGGIVGFADNDSIVHDCYFDGQAEATAVTNDEIAIAGESSPNNKYAFASYSVGGGYKSGYLSADSKAYLVVNSLAGSDVDLADKDAFTDKLSWQTYDWTFSANAYPQINYEPSSEQVSLSMKLCYVAEGDTTEILVDKQSSVTHIFFDSTVEQASSYAPMGNFFATGSLSIAYEADNGYLSYGYFFDEACTQPVPYAYMPAKDVTLYVGFADPAPLLESKFYYTADNGRLVTLTFEADGTVEYTDGNGTVTTIYSFDGENLLINSARLARYYLGQVIVDETDDSIYADANFDLYRYYYYNFVGKLTDEGITLYDGVYFTESAPLTAGKTEPTTQPNLPMNSYDNTWIGKNFTLTFAALGESGTGTALLTYEDESTLDLLYEDAETAGYTAIYLTDDGDEKGSLFGYFYYDESNNVLRAVLSDSSSTSGFVSCTLLLRDDCYGEWITVSDDFGNAEFIFDGLGLYGQGSVEIIKDGQSSTVNYSLNAALEGSFNYAGTAWSFRLNEEQTITVTGSSNNTELERKDFFANVDFVDENGNRYVFDGKGNLSVGGKFTVNGTTEYAYKADGTQDGQFLVYSDLNAAAIGSISITDTYVSLVLSGEESKLYIANDLMGRWAISGEFALFIIGPTDLSGEVSANYRGHDVTLVCLDPTLYYFTFTENSGLPMLYYVFVMDDETTGDNLLVLTEEENLLGDYIICSRANEMFGTWTSGKTTITFDGVSSGYQSGIAVLSKPLASDTLYYYTIKEDGILMWSQNLLQGRTKYFLIKMTDDLTNPSAYVNEDGKAFLRREVDGLCLTRATDTATGETYLFDGLCISGGNGGIWVGDVKKYEYSFITYNADNTATLTVIDLKTGKTHEATLNYKDQQNITFTLGDEIADSTNA